MSVDLPTEGSLTVNALRRIPMFAITGTSVRVEVDLTTRRITVEALRQRDDFVEAFALAAYPTV